MLVTLDMPVRLARLGIEWILQNLTGRKEKAGRTRDLLGAAGEFAIFGLPKFWRS
jgi:hypothetical protein